MKDLLVILSLSNFFNINAQKLPININERRLQYILFDKDTIYKINEKFNRNLIIFNSDTLGNKDESSSRYTLVKYKKFAFILDNNHFNKFIDSTDTVRNNCMPYLKIRYVPTRYFGIFIINRHKEIQVDFCQPCVGDHSGTVKKTYFIRKRELAVIN